MSSSTKTAKGHQHIYFEVPSDSTDDCETHYIGSDCPENRAKGRRIRLQRLNMSQHYEALIRECETEIGSLTKSWVNSATKRERKL